MGNNEITEIILSEKEIRCIFMAGALCMLTAWGEEQNQLSLHAPLSLPLPFFSLLPHSISPPGFA